MLTNDTWVVRVAQFEGPLDLLLHLIGEAKIDIKDIFVSDITEQYIASLEGVDSLEPDLASAFLEMAAALLFIKSRSLLPVPQKETDDDGISPEEALKQRLLQYKLMRDQAAALRSFEGAAALCYTKLPEDFSEASANAQVSITNLTAESLIKAWQKLTERVAVSRENQSAANEALMPSLLTDPYPFEFCREYLLEKLSSKEKTRKLLVFEELFDKAHTRIELVAVFITLLELIKQGVVAVKQSVVFDSILIRKI